MSDFTPAPVKALVSFSALEALDIRVGTIERVEDIPCSEQLLKLTVNFGDHSRTILAGMKQERENPREIEGKQALFVLNLEPKRMAGEISQGMLFDLGYADGILPALATPERPVPTAPAPANLSSSRRMLKLEQLLQNQLTQSPSLHYIDG
jgi:tRNA-binding protein